ncbi:hypothetical protein [Paraburkholderia mimosarum]|uniref:hypothetical protein n=1 Tax=Paraburkholderia mimosarum TaxID=312026 RepID=UPI0012B5BFB0|nr:hypothetical protein [Paraburkholderia mimosarum]
MPQFSAGSEAFHVDLDTGRHFAMMPVCRHGLNGSQRDSCSGLEIACEPDELYCGNAFDAADISVKFALCSLSQESIYAVMHLRD